ncbi:hypothetical protein CDAR_308551 [Caerostris darwini]|uniref:Uncharacterized protein n=1 Tax=Caerostris darwini TaxID=1538125 RepID=A0AAV4VC27_9ARAC|nr:hypothetical protein CDAR_308551 [Caerostris darwini]
MLRRALPLGDTSLVIVSSIPKAPLSHGSCYITLSVNTEWIETKQNKKRETKQEILSCPETKCQDDNDLLFAPPPKRLCFRALRKQMLSRALRSAKNLGPDVCFIDSESTSHAGSWFRIQKILL